MKLSDIAKELGYKTQELSALAKARGLPIENEKEINPHLRALIIAKIPQVSKLQGELKTMFVGIREKIRHEQEEDKKEKLKKKEEKEQKKLERQKKKEAAQLKKKKTETPAPVKTETSEHTKTTLIKTQIIEPVRTIESKPKVVIQFTEKIEEVSKPIIELREDNKQLRLIKSLDVERMEEEASVIAKGKAKPSKGVSKPKVKEKPKGKIDHHVEAKDKKRKKQLLKNPPKLKVPYKPPVIPADRKILIHFPVLIKDFSQIAGIKAQDILKKFMDQGLILNMNSELDEDMIVFLGIEFKKEFELVKPPTLEEKVLTKSADKPEDLKLRPPIVTFMGHVDHGKTSLLDKIRNANVASKEAGGITQHIGAYRVKVGDNKYITFLDTPGHQAFTAMRARGANVTDIVVIVVAADEGLMPQTEEAINHAKAAGVTILVAMNKIDKKEANIDKTRNQLASLGLIPENWGGNTIFVEVSALTGKGVPQLLEMISLQAELLELKSNPSKRANGVVIEARKSIGKGPVATVIVREGTLKRGDIVLCGMTSGKVRAMFDENGRQVDSLLPSMPAEIIGLSDVPEAGDHFTVINSLEDAQNIVNERVANKKIQATPREQVTLDNIFDKLSLKEEVKLILKTDVHGSREALIKSIEGIPQKEVKVKVLHSGVGNITESDVLLADASDAMILAFNAELEDRAKILAKDKSVKVKKFNIIYELLDELKRAIEGKTEPEKVTEVIGTCEVKTTFKISRFGVICGCIVTDGKIERSASVRVIRDKKEIFNGKFASLKRFKDDVREVLKGYECGIKIEGFDGAKAGDMLEAYVVKEI